MYRYFPLFEVYDFSGRDEWRRDFKSLSLNSQAKYRSGGHFKEKADILSLTNQEIMVDDQESHLKAMIPDIFVDYQNSPLTGDVAMAYKAWQIWQYTPFSWWQCQLNFALWCASAGCGFLFETTSKRRSPFSPACTASTPTIRPGACLKSCESPSQGINLILGMRTHISRGPKSGFALSLGYRQIRTGGRSWIMDVTVSDLGVSS